MLKAGALVGAGMLGLTRTSRADEPPPYRVITRGPKFHWFGYYDKLEFDATNRYVLGQEVDFEHRQPTLKDEIRVGMVDLEDGDRWIELGSTKAWCWQQGCMLQWIPGSESEVLWNDCEEDRFVCRILSIHTGQLRTIPHPIYALSPDGKTAVNCDFSRLNDTRPGYGYAGVPDPYANDPAPEGSGIWRVDLVSGQREMLFSLAEIASHGPRKATMKDAKHKFNHLLVSPDGKRLEFLHRWKGPHGRETRMFTAGVDGSNLRLLDDNGLTSHFIWRDPQHLLAFSRQPSHGARFYLFEDGGDFKIEPVGVDSMTEDGHVTYLPGGEWILNDTYPHDGYQYPYLYHVATDRKVPLGRFRAPAQYTGPWRCDTHPRSSRDGRFAVIDAPEARSGRQLHLIDLASIVG